MAQSSTKHGDSRTDAAGYASRAGASSRNGGASFYSGSAGTDRELVRNGLRVVFFVCFSYCVSIHAFLRCANVFSNNTHHCERSVLFAVVLSSSAWENPPCRQIQTDLGSWIDHDQNDASRVQRIRFAFVSGSLCVGLRVCSFFCEIRGVHVTRRSSG